MKILICLLLGLSVALAAQNFTSTFSFGSKVPGQFLLLQEKRFTQEFSTPQQRDLKRVLHYDGTEDRLIITEMTGQVNYLGEEIHAFITFHNQSGVGYSFYQGDAGCRYCYHADITLTLYGLKQSQLPPGTVLEPSVSKRCIGKCD